VRRSFEQQVGYYTPETGDQAYVWFMSPLWELVRQFADGRRSSASNSRDEQNCPEGPRSPCSHR
jgi:hypothetical protein